MNYAPSQSSPLMCAKSKSRFLQCYQLEPQFYENRLLAGNCLAKSGPEVLLTSLKNQLTSGTAKTKKSIKEMNGNWNHSRRKVPPRDCLQSISQTFGSQMNPGFLCLNSTFKQRFRVNSRLCTTGIPRNSSMIRRQGSWQISINREYRNILGPTHLY